MLSPRWLGMKMGVIVATVCLICETKGIIPFSSFFGGDSESPEKTVNEEDESNQVSWLIDLTSKALTNITSTEETSEPVIQYYYKGAKDAINSIFHPNTTESFNSNLNTSNSTSWSHMLISSTPWTYTHHDLSFSSSFSPSDNTSSLPYNSTFGPTTSSSVDDSGWLNYFGGSQTDQRKDKLENVELQTSTTADNAASVQVGEQEKLDTLDENRELVDRQKPEKKEELFVVPDWRMECDPRQKFLTCTRKCQDLTRRQKVVFEFLPDKNQNKGQIETTALNDVPVSYGLGVREQHDLHKCLLKCKDTWLDRSLPGCSDPPRNSSYSSYLQYFRFYSSNDTADHVKSSNHFSWDEPDTFWDIIYCKSTLLLIFIMLLVLGVWIVLFFKLWRSVSSTARNRHAENLQT